VKDTTTSYDAVKEYEGRKYTGMRVGGNHSWYYGQGEWEETKVTPDKWQFTYAVKKRRKWDAPEGSGALTGTEYHWYILAHQNVRKLNANEYSTSMTGTKYKLAHRRAGSEAWSASDRVQLRQLIAILEENIQQLRKELGEVDSPSGEKNQRLKERVGRGMLPGNFALGMLGQPPLEVYASPTRATGAGSSASPALGSRSSSSSNSDFFPKNCG
jgi:hypothetical protein